MKAVRVAFVVVFFGQASTLPLGVTITDQHTGLSLASILAESGLAELVTQQTPPASQPVAELAVTFQEKVESASPVAQTAEKSTTVQVCPSPLTLPGETSLGEVVDGSSAVDQSSPDIVLQDPALVSDSSDTEQAEEMEGYGQADDAALGIDSSLETRSPELFFNEEVELDKKLQDLPEVAGSTGAGSCEERQDDVCERRDAIGIVAPVVPPLSGDAVASIHAAAATHSHLSDPESAV